MRAGALVDREARVAPVPEVRTRDRVVDAGERRDLDRLREGDAAVMRYGDDLLVAVDVAVVPGHVDGAVGPGADGRVLPAADRAVVVRRRDLDRARPRLAAVVGERDPDRLREERERAAAEVRVGDVHAPEERRGRIIVGPDVLVVVEEESLAVRSDDGVGPGDAVVVRRGNGEQLGRLVAVRGAGREAREPSVV